MGTSTVKRFFVGAAIAVGVVSGIFAAVGGALWAFSQVLAAFGEGVAIISGILFVTAIAGGMIGLAADDDSYYGW
jgi:hypothetical protein